MSLLSHNFIVFYPNDDRLPRPAPNGYQTLCMKDLEGVEGIHLVPYPLHYLPYLFRYLYFVINSNKLKHIIPPRVKRVFFPFVFDKKYLSDKPICFLFIGGANSSADYFCYLKKEYPDCKIVWFFRDLVRVGENRMPDSVHNNNIDIEMSFDIGEAKKYGMPFCPEISSYVELPEHDIYPSCDVFFCGKAKDRYERLLSYYKFFTNKGLKCNFYIAGVPIEEQYASEGLYYNRFMPYKEMLCRSYNAKCLLDINQEEAWGGYTSRFYEAIMYNRKLISDNPITEDSCFYNKHDIIYVSKPEDVTDEFIKNIGTEVNYHYNGEFSPMRMIEYVEALLNNSSE